MKFLVDMPLSASLACWLRERGHDAVHAFEVGLGSASDGEIVGRAWCEERVVLRPIWTMPVFWRWRVLATRAWFFSAEATSASPRP
ncbi:MAG: DUF5615 family PIN-like protein [Bacillota bacterium]